MCIHGRFTHKCLRDNNRCLCGCFSCRLREAYRKWISKNNKSSCFAGCFTSACNIITSLCRSPSVNKSKESMNHMWVYTTVCLWNVPSSGYSECKASMSSRVSGTRRSNYGGLADYCKQSATVHLTEWCCFRKSKIFRRPSVCVTPLNSCITLSSESLVNKHQTGCSVWTDVL